MFRALGAMLLLLTLPSTGSAEVVVEIMAHPILDDHRASHPTEEAVGVKTFEPRQAWWIPHFRVDRTQPGDTTLLAIALPPSAELCEDYVVCSNNVVIQYYDAYHRWQRTETFDLPARSVKTINLRDVPGLAVDADGFARGMLTVYATFRATVDYFQVDTSENLATGGPAMTRDHWCRRSMARFLSFGPGQGSVLSFYVPEPHGTGGAAPPTVLGEVYDESGTFVNSFVIHTDQWAFEVETESFVQAGTHFGTVEVMLDGGSDQGMLTVRHGAEDRFSIGLDAACIDD